MSKIRFENPRQTSGNPFPPANSNPFAATDAASARTPPPEPKYIDPIEYETNEVIQTVRELVNNSRDDTWSGTANELLAAGQQKMRLTDLTARQVEQRIKDLEDYLRIYDDIYHFFYRSGDVMMHSFSVAQPDEDGVY